MRKYMSKRQRPCDLCRSKRSACRIDASPPCRLCQLSGLDCTFVEAARPRKQYLDSSSGATAAYSPTAMTMDNTNSESSAIPEILAQESNHEDNEPLLPAADTQLLQDLDLQGFEDPFIFQTPCIPETIVGGPMRSILEENYSECTAGPAGPSLDGDTTSSPEAIGLTSDMDPYLLQYYRTNDCGLFKFKKLTIYSVQKQSVPVQFLLSPRDLWEEIGREDGVSAMRDGCSRARLELLIPTSIGKRLISLYSKFIAPYYPVFAASRLPDPRASSTGLLAAIYTIVAPFAHQDEGLHIEFLYDTFPFQGLDQVLKASLDVERHAPNLEAVQTLLLPVLKSPATTILSDASHRWTMMGTLVSAAINIGLHLDPTLWTLQPSEIAQRRRLSFLIFSTDKWLASSLGRPPLISSDNWLISSLSSPDKLDSGIGDDNWTQLMIWSSLTKALHSALSDLQ